MNDEYTDDKISERYYRLILAHETDKCLPIITDVISASEIQSDSIAPKNVDCAYISIMTCIMNSVSEVIREEMLDTADKLMQWYELQNIYERKSL